MNASSLFSLDNLTEIRLRDGVDMRPTLLRVLTDLYVQKLAHTPDEDRHYTELAMRLLDGVDAATRADIAARLARHLSPPLRVVQYLLNDLPEIGAPLRAHRTLDRATEAAAIMAPAAATLASPTPALGPAATPRPPAPPVATMVPAAAPTMEPIVQPVAANLKQPTPAARGTGTAILPADTAADLNEQFFTATGEARRLILLGLHLVAPIAPGRIALSRDPKLGKKLEAAALAHQSDELATQLAQALRVPREQARRIARDQFGEPITVALKALAIPRDLVYRILMFVNPTVGQSVERVHALALLFDEMTLPAAEGMVGIWQALPGSARAGGRHQPLLWNDETTRARATMTARRSLHTTPLISKRRDAS